MMEKVEDFVQEPQADLPSARSPGTANQGTPGTGPGQRGEVPVWKQLPLRDLGDSRQSRGPLDQSARTTGSGSVALGQSLFPSAPVLMSENPIMGASWIGGTHLRGPLGFLDIGQEIYKPDPHISPQISLYLLGFLFKQLMTVKELPLFSCSPRLPPRGHFGNLWHVVLQRGVGGVGGVERSGGGMGPAGYRAPRQSFLLCVKHLLQRFSEP